MKSQKEMARFIQEEISDKQRERVELDVIKDIKNDLIRERKVSEAIMHEAIAEKGYIISVPDTEVILYEDEGYQLLYCNSIDNPGKVIFLMALKQAVRKVTGRTAITVNGYLAVPIPRDQFNLILASHQRHNRVMNSYKERVAELEKEIAPLRYIDHLIKTHKIDTDK